ncbi:MAG: acyl-CoA dehydrogenase family protein [Caulobacteraceae bacterium]|nr:acyl-CoA dehydrogenase family protein [Caulobacter sp.]
MAVLTEDQAMLRDAAVDWGREQAPVDALRRLRDAGASSGFDAETWSGMAQMGFPGVMAPEAAGGAGLDLTAMGLVLEALGRTLAASPLLSTGVIGVVALTRGGSEAQKAEWLPKFAAGEAVAALALEEGPRHEPLATTLAARREGDGYVLDGAKTFVLDGVEADVLIVAARESGAPGEAEGIVLLLVPADTSGIARERLDLIDSRGAGAIRFEGVRVPAEAALIGGAGLLEHVLDAARAALAAEMLGQAASAFEQTLDYLKTRTQFGQLIGGFQALQHRAAKMFTAIELARSAVERALRSVQEDRPDAPAAASLAKALAGDALHLVSNDMVQMHGGIGMTDAHDAGLFLKRARVAEAAFGGQAYHRDRWARLHGF